MASAISLREVTKLFGRFAALREVTADFSAGKLCAIFGRPGVSAWAKPILIKSTSPV